MDKFLEKYNLPKLNQEEIENMKKKKKKKLKLWNWNCDLKTPNKDFHGGPVVKTVFPMQGVWVWSLVREQDPISHNN